MNQQVPSFLKESKGVETGKWYSVTTIIAHSSSFFIFVLIEMNDSRGSSTLSFAIMSLLLFFWLLRNINEAESDEFSLTFT